MLTPEQEEIRKTGIGGSDAAKVCGLSKWGTPFDVYQEKMGLAPKKEVTDAMKRGVALEQMILDEYDEMMRSKIWRPDKNDPPFRSDKNNFMLANLDGWDKERNIVVEAKTVRDRREWGPSGSIDVPKDYLFQVAHYCVVKNTPEAHIIARFELQGTYDIFIYKRNEILENAMIKKQQNFWEQNVLAQVPPPVTSIVSAKEAFKYAADESVIADIETQTKLMKFLSLEKMKKEIENQQEELKLDLMLRMGVANKLKDDENNLLVSWNNVNTNRFDVDLFKRTHPELYQKFLRLSSSRRFLPNYKYGA